MAGPNGQPLQSRGPKLTLSPRSHVAARALNSHLENLRRLPHHRATAAVQRAFWHARGGNPSCGTRRANGDWIHYYNGNYFIFFHPADSSGPNRWDIDTNGYVQQVCNTNPL
jgi:hypothetical protein